jgi:hypothetical protein
MRELDQLGQRATQSGWFEIQAVLRLPPEIAPGF